MMNLRVGMIVRFLLVAFGLNLLSCLFLLCLMLAFLHSPEERVSVKDFCFAWKCSIPVGFVTAYFPCSLNGFPKWGWFVSCFLVLLWDTCIIGVAAIF